MTDTSNKEAALLEFMSCEKLGGDLFRGQSKDLNTGQVYGGQVLGQAIYAATSTVDVSRSIRSAHAYFIRKGDVTEPIIYQVDRALDGGSVSSRVVGANQHGKQILHLSASYHVQEEGFDYQPIVKLPIEALDKALNENLLSQHPFYADYFDVVLVEDKDKTNPKAIQFWIKAKETLVNQEHVHQTVLAYVTDMGLLQSTLLPHGLHAERASEVAMFTIDHAIWFHRPFKADQWFLYECEAISNSGARGLARGSLFDTSGTLFASTAQEGLLRKKK